MDFKEYWETKDGRILRYRDMTDLHLVNTHEMLSRGICKWTNKCMSINEELDLPEWVEDALEGLEAELRRRGLLDEDS